MVTASADVGFSVAPAGGQEQENHDVVRQGTNTEAVQKRYRAWHTPLLAALVACIASAEIWLVCSPDVPWLIDKLFFIVCLAFQVALAIALVPAVPRNIRAKVVNLCHWAFVILVYAAALLMRAVQSLSLIACLALASVVLRLCMQNTCIITTVGQREFRGPRISRNQATWVFTGLFIVSVLRLCLMLVLWPGFPYAEPNEAVSHAEQTVSGRENPTSWATILT